MEVKKQEVEKQISDLEQNITSFEKDIEDAGEEKEELEGKIEKVKDELKYVSQHVGQWNLSLKQAQEQVALLRKEVDAMLALQTD